jgi:hypothetical protein
LEQEFNLPPIAEVTGKPTPVSNTIVEIADDVEIINNGLSISEQINTSLKTIRSHDDHTTEMDDISDKALDSYAQLMALGMNVSDMAAGKIFAEASTFLKLAMESRDAKAKIRATELDLMLKKLKIDKSSTSSSDGINELNTTQIFDRNDLLKIMKDGPPEKT